MKDFILPDIGEGIVECELLKWLVSEGDFVKEDQAVAEVMTDKATVEIPAMHDGKVVKLYYKEGDIAKVHAPLFALIADEDQSIDAASENVPNNADHFIAEQQTPSVEISASAKVESFVLPDIGEGIVECEIMQWHVQAGDVVKEDQVVVEVMTDKAVVEIPAKYDGKILTIHYQKGDIAKVHTPLFDQQIAGAGNIDSAAQGAVNQNADDSYEQTNSLPHGDTKQSSTLADVDIKNNKQGENFAPPVQVNRAIASPAVRRLARQLSVTLTDISASGKKGRVLKLDVLNAASNTSTNESKATTVQQKVISAPTAPANSQQDRVEPIKGIRAAMAKQMMASVSTIPHFSVSDELCMDNLIQLRESLKPAFEKQDLKLSFLPFFIKALSLAMHSYPILNSRLNEQASELTYLSSHNIGVAIDGQLGLMVPSIKNVQNLSLFEVTQELNRLIKAARDGKLSNADLSGCSISISNVGVLGGITATPVINKPDVAIVALGKTQKLPRFNEHDEVVAKHIMMLNWSADHRVIDGATMVKFNTLWSDYLAHPDKMLVHLR